MPEICPLKITAIHALQDNYIWVLHIDADRVWIVDPGEAGPVFEYLKKSASSLAGILLTHHHHDHSGGIAALQKKYDIPAIASRGSRIPEITRFVTENEIFLLPDTTINIKSIEIPGHTLDHIAFVIEDAIFCGDTLFTGGAGRLFEGTAHMMWHSLQKLMSLGDHMKIYCGHEYTESNLRFACIVEPYNLELKARIEKVRIQRLNNEPTVPEYLAIEKATNPFLRVRIPAVKKAAESYAGCELPTPEAVFSVIREWKNHFK